MSKEGFYDSARWRALRLQALQRDKYKCVHCGVSVAGYKKSRVDHVIERKVRPDLALTLSNLRTLCGVCDNRRHADKLGNAPKVVVPTGEDGWPMPADGVGALNVGGGGFS
jgi:5-methylcytosine-specific restriction protein A